MRVDSSRWRLVRTGLQPRYDGLTLAGRARWIPICALLLGLAPLGCVADTFACQEDTNCSANGVCVEGSCAFPSDDCDSGLRFGDHAEAGLAGQCVVPMGSTGSSDSSTATSSTSTSSTTSASPVTVTGMEGSSTSDSTGSSTSATAGSSTSATSASTGTTVGFQTGDTETLTGRTSSSSSSSSSSSTGTPSVCSEEFECLDCVECVGDSAAECADEHESCSDVPGCLAVFACFTDCFALGLCLDDCCAEESEQAVNTAMGYRDCASEVCVFGCQDPAAICND